MNRKWMKFGVLSMALVFGLFLAASVASAQGPGQGPIGPGGRGFGGPQNSLVAIAAQVLGMDQSTLVATLNTGKTIADVAKDKGVALDKIVDAVVADRAERLKSAVTAGQMTQAQADDWLAQIKTNVTAQLSAKFTPRGYGPGTGFVDANNDGVCDNMTRGPRGGGWR